MRSYAIGDVHGQLDRLCIAHDLIAQDRARCGDDAAPVIHLGDLVDRGPNSRGVLDFAVSGIRRGAPWQFVQGNHDRMFAQFLDDPRERDPRLRAELSWLDPRIGGAETLASYGVANPNDRPVTEAHAAACAAVAPERRALLGQMAPWHLRGEVLFVHAGIRPGIALADQDPDDLCWIREPFLSDEADHGVLVVHGHTAIKAARHYGNRVNLDTSAGYGGPVTAAVFEGRDVWVLSDAGRSRLWPD
jgi:serine/threonine protein phosphatase 1